MGSLLPMQQGENILPVVQEQKTHLSNAVGFFMFAYNN